MDLSLLEIEILSGAFTGYITNSLAIKMLFKKYGPFGGIIVKTRKEFTDNISKLIEKNFIKSDILKKELDKEKFRNIITHIIEDFLYRSIYYNTGELLLKEVPNIEKAIDNIFIFNHNDYENLLLRVLDTILPEIKINEILSEKQLKHLLKQILVRSMTLINNNQIFEDFIIRLYTKNKEKNIQSFISSDLLQKISKSTINYTNNFHLKLKNNFAEKIEQNTDFLYSVLGITSLIAEREKKIKNSTFSDLLTNKEKTDPAYELLTNLSKLLKTVEGKKLLTCLLKNSLGLLKKNKLTIISLLGKEQTEQINIFLQQRLSLLQDELVLWLKTNKKDIENLINKSIKKSLDKEKNTGLKKFIYRLFNKNIPAKYNPVTKIIKYLEDEYNYSIITKKISNTIQKTLTEYELGEIITILEERNIINIEKIEEYLERKLTLCLSNSDFLFFNKLLMTKIGDVIKISWSDYFETNLKDSLIKKFNDDYLFTPITDKKIQKLLHSAIFKIGQGKIKDLCREDVLSNKNLTSIKTNILNKLKNKQVHLAIKITSFFNKIVKNKPLSDLLNKGDKNKLTKTIKNETTYYFKRKLLSILNKKITFYYGRLSKLDKLTINIKNYLIKLIEKGSPHLLKGKISAIIATNLSKVSDQKIQIMLENYMGKELKPITFFGALLGSITAIILYFSQKIYTISSELNLLLSVLVYGFIGYLTNIIALQMIFKPYHVKKIWGIRIPFTPGVISREKPRIAISMGNFIDKELLNKDTMAELLKEKRTSIEQYFLTKIGYKNYQLIEETLFKHRKNLSKIILKQVLKILIHKKNFLLDELLIICKKVNLNNICFSPLIINIKKAIINSNKRIIKYLNDHLKKIENKKLINILPSYIKEIIYGKIAKKTITVIEKLINKINTVSLRNYLKPYLYKTPAEIIPKENINKLIDNISYYVINKINTPTNRKKLLSFLQLKLKGSSFFYKKMRSFILEIILQNSQKILTQKKKLIKKNIINAVSKEMGIWYRIGKFINVDITLSNAIDILLDQEIPLFLDSRKKEFAIILNKSISNLKEKKINKLDINLNKDIFHDIIICFISPLMDIKLEYYVKIFSINNNQNLEEHLQKFIDSLKEKAISQKEIIAYQFTELFKDIFDKLILSIDLRNITKDFSKEDILNILDKTIETITNSQDFNKLLDEYFILLLEELKNNPLAEIINLNYLKDDLNCILENLLANKKIKEILLPELEKTLEKNILSLNHMIDKESKDFFAALAINSLLDSIQLNFFALLNSLDTAKITEKEINKLKPAEIEELIYSFAGRYITQLENYGWLGSIIGLIAQLLKNIS